MKRAIELAVNGWGKTGREQLAGVVIVKDDWVIGESFSGNTDGNNVIVSAIKKANSDISGSTLYTNIEPYCAEDIIPDWLSEIVRTGISDVVIGMLNPESEASGLGIKILNQAEIQTEIGVMEDKAKKLYEMFTQNPQCAPENQSLIIKKLFGTCSRNGCDGCASGCAKRNGRCGGCH